MIEQLIESDFLQVKELVTTTVLECIEAEQLELQSIIEETLKGSEDWLQDQSSGIHLVYKVCGEIKGMILIQDYWNLTSLFVYPSCHRKGIAQDLLNQAIELCRGKSPNNVIKLNSSNFASGFYEKFGFEKAGDARDLPGGCIPYKYNL